MLKKLLPQIKNHKILITGGAGFIGSHIAQILAADNQVVIYDNFRRNALRYIKKTNLRHIHQVAGDILDTVGLDKVVRGQDYVIHLAAIAGVSSYEKNPLQTLEIDALGTYNILKLASHYKTKQVLLFSSSEVYGAFAHNVSENDATNQGAATESRWSYGVGKLVGDHFSFAFSKMTGLVITVVRPFNVYGPLQVGEGAIQIFISQALKNKTITVRGSGKQIRAWCYVSDVVAAVIQMLGNKQAFNQIFNIGNPTATLTINELAQQIIKLSNSSSDIKHVKPLTSEVVDRSPNVDKANRILGFIPKVSLKEGLIATILWYKGNYALQ